MADFKRYGNMFYSYRSTSVSSPPEVLKNQRKREDPTPQMDIYSFGMIMWEFLYEQLPFDGDVAACAQYVVEDDARPQIVTAIRTESVQLPSGLLGETMDGAEHEQIMLTEDLANIIRKCW